MSWGSAQEGLSELIRQASCSVAVQLLVQLSRTVMRSQFVVLIASLGLGSWPDSSRLRAYSVSTTVSIPTSGRAGSGLDQGYPGGTQHALAEVSPPHLATMIPIDSLSNCGVSGMRHGGAFELRFMNWIFQIGAPNSKAALANPRLRQALMESGLRIRQHADSLTLRTGTPPLRVVPEYEAWLVEAMRNGPEAPFWHTMGMSVVDHINDYADVPVLHITGWYDS
jgi:hypothetical protein